MGRGTSTAARELQALEIRARRDMHEHMEELVVGLIVVQIEARRCGGPAPEPVGSAEGGRDVRAEGPAVAGAVPGILNA